jgi:hypothetical protein
MVQKIMYVGWVGLCAGLLLACVLPRMDTPLMVDDVHFAGEAEHDRYQGYLESWHPPLYPDLLRWCRMWIGWHDADLRWSSLIFGVLVMVALMWYGEQLATGIGILAGFLWMLHPLVVQSRTILDIDNTLLPLGFVLLLFRIMSWTFPLTRRQLFELILGFTALLCCKLTSPLALLPALVLVACLQRRIWMGVRTAAIVGLSGSLIFLVLWTWYATVYQAPYGAVFGRTTEMVLRGPSGLTIPPLMELINRCVRVGVWLDPAVLCLWGWSLWRWWTRRTTDTRIAALDIWCAMSLVMFLGYALIGGTIFGLAKYHIPLVALMMLPTAALLVYAGHGLTRQQWVQLALICVITVPARFYIVGDLIYAVNYTIRLAHVLSLPDAGSTAQLAFAGTVVYWGGWTGVVLLCCVITLRMFRHTHNAGRYGIACLVMVLSTYVAVNLIHLRAPFSTTYAYGRPFVDYAASVAFSRSYHAQYPDRVIIGPEDELYTARVLQHMPTEFQYTYLQTRANFLRAIRDPRVGAIIYEPVYNSSIFYRTILPDTEVQRALYTRFTRRDMGNHVVWTTHE